jgi:hypothetical protein
LLDLLASIEGGFNVVEKITTRSTDSKATELSGGTEFGIANILNLLKIDLKGSASRAKEQISGEERQTERYHTYGSLLNRLRGNLLEAELVKQIVDEKSWGEASTSDFIELSGKFVPNPLLSCLHTINRIISIILLTGSLNIGSQSGSSTASHKLKDQSRQMPDIRKFVEGLIKDLEHGSMETYVVESNRLLNHKIVVSLFTEYMRDRSGTEVPHGEFRVLGKIVRKVDEGDSIDLIRGSALSGLSEEILSPFLGAFRELGEKGIKIPNIITKVEPPVMQVIPIAIYV